jgi:hypothetical protein
LQQQQQQERTREAAATGRQRRQKGHALQSGNTDDDPPSGYWPACLVPKRTPSTVRKTPHTWFAKRTHTYQTNDPNKPTNTQRRTTIPMHACISGRQAGRHPPPFFMSKNLTLSMDWCKYTDCQRWYLI